MKTNIQIITREFAEQNILYFYPSSTEEAEQVLKKLFDLGFLTGFDQERDVSYDAIHKVLDKGIMVLGKRTAGYSSGIYTADQLSSYKEQGLLCTVDQFSAATAPVPTPQVLEEFRALREELAALRTEIAEIKAAVVPSRVDKKKGQTL